jgi:hypothetical protein
MKDECYQQGSCTMCGCRTTALQMANKSCDYPCYPPLMNKRKWKNFVTYKSTMIDNRIWAINQFGQILVTNGYIRDKVIAPNKSHKEHELFLEMKLLKNNID